LSYLCSQIIHSKVFSFGFGGESKRLDEISNFFLNPDKTYKKKVYLVSWEKWIDVISTISNYKVDLQHSRIEDDGSETKKMFQFSS